MILSGFKKSQKQVSLFTVLVYAMFVYLSVSSLFFHRLVPLYFHSSWPDLTRPNLTQPRLTLPHPTTPNKKWCAAVENTAVKWIMVQGSAYWLSAFLRFDRISRHPRNSVSMFARYSKPSTLYPHINNTICTICTICTTCTICTIQYTQYAQHA